jgi:polar amino acid transport system substrate-binding protein
MHQLTQKLGSGQMTIEELPLPQISKGMVLVQNHYSIISAGTEGSTVSTARKSLIGKAKERPQQVKQVIDVLKTQGPIQTYRAVMKKLDAYSPLGYSSAGVVMEVGEGVTGIAPGDKVACAGAGYANHAEVVAVPVNLCVKLSPNANLKDAAYNTLGAIALQGVRQADLRLGESCAVIGLGLLGQLTALQLKASGVKVIGIDIDTAKVEMAKTNGAVDLGLSRSAPGIDKQIGDFTSGLGVDATIITAATDSLDPINFSGAITRKKGKVVVVGAVPTGFDRDPHWYKKELELLMACSYGPGRYDFNYEEKGIDYPAAYVRWTEKRNMEAFQYLLASKSIEIGYLTTHEFPLEKAVDAYDMIMKREEDFAGIALSYDVGKLHQRQAFETGLAAKGHSNLSISFIGAGSYAQGNLLPNLPDTEKVHRYGVLTNTGTTSKRVAEKHAFQLSTDRLEDLLTEKDNVWFIATRHDTHAGFVIKGLENGKHVFVEKPLCLTYEELEQIADLKRKAKTAVMVGFNRRFAPLTTKLKKQLPEGTMSMIYRVNAGAIPKDSWIQDLETGGGRIIGEACHFIDYMTHLNGSLPVSLSATALPDPEGLNDTVNILIEFSNGSTGVVAYYANGAKSLPKEYIEVHTSGISAVLDNFKVLTIYGKGKPNRKKLLNQDKGQKQMVNDFLSNLEKNRNSPIPFEDIYAVSKASIDVLTSIREGGARIKI